MEIKSKKYINEGFNSKAYIINDEYILLEGVNKNSYDNYKKYSESLNKLVDVKSLQIPNIIELIAPNNEFPNGAMDARGHAWHHNSGAGADPALQRKGRPHARLDDY